MRGGATIMMRDEIRVIRQSSITRMVYSRAYPAPFSVHDTSKEDWNVD